MAAAASGFGLPDRRSVLRGCGLSFTPARAASEQQLSQVSFEVF